MVITDIRIRRMAEEEKLKAYATITLEDCFIIHNIRIVQGENSIFVAMPNQKTKHGKYQNIAHPIKHEFWILLQKQILNIYGKMVEQGKESNYNDE